MNVIEGTHNQWRELINGKTNKGSLNLWAKIKIYILLHETVFILCFSTNTTLSSKDSIDQASANGIVSGFPEVGTNYPEPETSKLWCDVSN